MQPDIQNLITTTSLPWETQINIAKNWVPIINNEVDTDFNVEVSQKVEKDYDQPPSTVYSKKEVNGKAFISQSKAIVQESKLVPDIQI